MLAAHRRAKRHVHMETYIFEDDEVGRQFAARLEARAQAGREGAPHLRRRGLDQDAEGILRGPSPTSGVRGARVQSGRPGDRAQGRARRAQPSRPSQAHRRRRPRRLPRRHQHQRRVRLVLVGPSLGAGTRRRRRPCRSTSGPGATRRCASRAPSWPTCERAFLDQWAGADEGRRRSTDKRYFPQLAPQGPHVVRAIEGSPSRAGRRIAMYVTLISAIDNAETRRAHHERLLRPARAAARALQRRGAARRRREADPAQPHRQLARLPRRALVLRATCSRPA